MHVTCGVMLSDVLCRPFWLSPRQVLLILSLHLSCVLNVFRSPPSALMLSRTKEYAAEIAGRLSVLGLWADVITGRTPSEEDPERRNSQYNFIFGTYKCFI